MKIKSSSANAKIYAAARNNPFFNAGASGPSAEQNPEMPSNWRWLRLRDLSYSRLPTGDRGIRPILIAMNQAPTLAQSMMRASQHAWCISQDKAADYTPMLTIRW